MSTCHDYEVNKLNSALQTTRAKLNDALKSKEEAVQRCLDMSVNEQEHRDRRSLTETHMHLLRRANCKLREVNNRLSLEVQDMVELLTEEGKQIPAVEYHCSADETIEQFLHQSSSAVQHEIHLLQEERAVLSMALAESKRNQLPTPVVLHQSPCGSKTDHQWTVDYNSLREKYLALAAAAKQLKSEMEVPQQLQNGSISQWRNNSADSRSLHSKLKMELQQCKSEADEEQARATALLRSYEERLWQVTKETQDVIASKSAEAEQIRVLQCQLSEAEIRMEELVCEKQVQYDQIVLKYKQEERKRRRLYNELQELKGNVRVLCRLKPLLPEEQSAVELLDWNTVSVTDERQTRKFEFDCCFGPSCTQTDVYAEVKPLAMSVLDGYNVCIFAYGQTASGKTHTMEGGHQLAQRGINYRAVEELYEISNSRVPHYGTQISVSAVEIYNNVVYDLLNERCRVETKTGKITPHIKIVRTSTTEELLGELKKGYTCRNVAATEMNKQSSRSHCIVTVYTEVQNLKTGETVVGKLNLVDLAGSERLKRTNATGQQKREAECINLSLTMLKGVMNALASKAAYVPYRNSILTQSLQDSLDGNCKCLMFANISMAATNCKETSSTLSFASECKAVEVGKVLVNKN
eukprot:TRINITY_DN67666_c13_g2_i3.p1 TRINITY_DN67666_c13_g2~~TRINITY_DN67666_c13_g2_i3.p1  ORF type:complete len:637 (-),score=45.50 TRINITY_DN67666_c13_g2_i3:207-2117(-)